MVDDEDVDIEERFQRQTDLKSLRIERSYVNFEALKRILLAPRALSYLSISHVELYWHHELKNAEDNSAEVPDFVEALLPQRLSLEEIKVVVEKKYGWSPTINDPSFRDHAARFPMLKRWLGCDKSTLVSHLNY
jgi:hypothetical protein